MLFPYPLYGVFCIELLQQHCLWGSMPHLAFNAWIYTFLLLCPCRLTVEQHGTQCGTQFHTSSAIILACFTPISLSSIKGNTMSKQYCFPNNILWVCWGPSHVKLYYSIGRRTLSNSRNSGECSRCLSDTEVIPVTAQSLLLGAWSHKSLS